MSAVYRTGADITQRGARNAEQKNAAPGNAAPRNAAPKNAAPKNMVLKNAVQKEAARIPRFMLAAEKSGGGKTMLTCVLLWLLKKQGLRTGAFKCGPDYIDPMFHRRVLGVPSCNLDSFFSDEDTIRGILGRHAAGRTAVLEGVMGYYDGLGGTSWHASSYDIARITDTPVILLADASGRSLSTIAAIRGFMEYRPDSRIKGVIFNRTPASRYPALAEAAIRELGIRPVGFVPPLEGGILESRHLGLVMPDEIPEFQEKIRALAERIEPGIDLSAVTKIAAEAPPLAWQRRRLPRITVMNAKSAKNANGVMNAKSAKNANGVKNANGAKNAEVVKSPEALRIAVAMDEAFCFYYQENLELMERMGAKLCFFSPLHDPKLPEGIGGLYLGGGYPELHAKGLAENETMRASVKAAIVSGLPCIAECGGYLYLKEMLKDADGKEWPMAGVLAGTGEDFGKLSRFGYGIMTAKEDGVLGARGSRFRVHEFHRWDCVENGSSFRMEKPSGGRSWECGYMTETLYAGFPHLYFEAEQLVPFLRKAAERGRG